jgi:murein DD-endopeptidase MepM/ murein hydrolase activator NlpD
MIMWYTALRFSTQLGFRWPSRVLLAATGMSRSFWDGDELVLELDAAGNPVREYSAYPGIDHPFAARAVHQRGSDRAGGGINPFAYVGEDPGNGRDPWGLVAVAITVVGDAPCDEIWYWVSHPDICPGPPPDPGGAGVGGGFPPLVGGHGGGGGGRKRATAPPRPAVCRNVLGGGPQALRPNSGFMDRGGEHQGVDILSRVGAPVTAYDDGVVVAAGWNPNKYGYEVIIRHTSPGGGAYYTEYAHLQQNLFVQRGERVGANWWLGFVGTTGYPQDQGIPPHLHFEVRTMFRSPGTAGHVDPAGYLCLQ